MKLTLAEAIAHIDALIEGKETSEEVSNWASAMMIANDNDTLMYEPPSMKKVIWEIIIYLVGADLLTIPTGYFHDMGDFIEFRKQFNKYKDS